jgi:hypothetical protein
LRYSEVYVQWYKERLKTKPGALRISEDADRPLSWYQGYYIPLSTVMRELHVGYKEMLRILDEECLGVCRIGVGDRHYCYISPDYMPRLTRIYGNDAARARRMKRWIVSKKPPLQFACPHCKKRGKQWRNGFLESGKRCYKCGYCKRLYSYQVHPNDVPPPLP